MITPNHDQGSSTDNTIIRKYDQGFSTDNTIIPKYDQGFRTDHYGLLGITKDNLFRTVAGIAILKRVTISKVLGQTGLSKLTS